MIGQSPSSQFSQQIFTRNTSTNSVAHTRPCPCRTSRDEHWPEAGSERNIGLCREFGGTYRVHSGTVSCRTWCMRYLVTPCTALRWGLRLLIFTRQWLSGCTNSLPSHPQLFHPSRRLVGRH